MIAFAPDPPPDGVDFATAEWVLRQLVLLSQSASATQQLIVDTGGIQEQIDVLEIQLAALATALSALQNQVAALSQSLATHIGNIVDAHGVDHMIELEGV